MATSSKTKSVETKPKTSSGGSGKKPPKRPIVTTGGSRDKDSGKDDGKGPKYGYPKPEPKSGNPYMRVERGKGNKYGK